MIRPIQRFDIFKDCPNLGAEIARIQQEQYDTDELDYFETENEKRQYLSSFDALGLPGSTLDFYYKVISFHHANLGTFTNELAVRLQQLMDFAGIAPTILITHMKKSMSVHQSNGRATGNALKRYMNAFPEPDFENAFLTDREDFPMLIDLFFRLTRSEPAAPEYIFFADRNDRLAFFVCRYGNVHTVEFGTEVLTLERLSQTQWFEVKTRCYEKFD